jgi:hypothetical protein
MPHGEFSVPGPGFLPTLLGVLLCGVSLALGIRGLLHRTTTERIEIGHPYIWSAIVAICVLAFFLEPIGFIPTIALFVGFFLKTLSERGWVASIVLGTAAAICAYLFFNRLLGIYLPLGFWF